MKPQTQRRVRQIHLYLGVFFAPAIILFALSGALQTFRWQEEKGYGGTPPGWIVWIAAFHKDQALPRAEPPREARAAPAKAAEKAGPAKKGGKSRRSFSLQVFTGIMSIGLMLSALLGIVLALNSRATRAVSVAMLALGSVVPLVLLYV